MPKRSPVTDDADRDREAVLPADVVSGDSKLPPQVRTWGVRFLILAGLASTLLWVGAIVYLSLIHI